MAKPQKLSKGIITLIVILSLLSLVGIIAGTIFVIGIRNQMNEAKNCIPNPKAIASCKDPILAPPTNCSDIGNNTKEACEKNNSIGTSQCCIWKGN